MQRGSQRTRSDSQPRRARCRRSPPARHHCSHEGDRGRGAGEVQRSGLRSARGGEKWGAQLPISAQDAGVCTLVPYGAHHVETYHGWMADPWIQGACPGR